MLSSLTAPGPRSRTILPQWLRYPLHAMTFAAGVDTATRPTYDFHGLKRGSAPWALFQFTLAGQGMLTARGQTAPLLPNQAMLVYLPDDHRYFLPPGGQWTFFYLCLQGSEIMRAWQQAVQTLGQRVTLPARSPLKLAAARLCQDILDDRIQSPWELSSRSYDLAMKLLALSQENTAPSGDKQRKRLPAIQRAIDHARAHIDQDLDVAALARVAGLSRHHFSRLFAASEGMGPGEYLARLRLRQAVRLLQTTQSPIKNIAADCGYEDANYFAKSFRKAYGLSPQAFRSRMVQR